MLIDLLGLVHEPLELVFFFSVKQQHLLFQPVHGLAVTVKGNHDNVGFAYCLEAVEFSRQMEGQLTGFHKIAVGSGSDHHAAPVHIQKLPAFVGFAWKVVIQRTPVVRNVLHCPDIEGCFQKNGI